MRAANTGRISHAFKQACRLLKVDFLTATRAACGRQPDTNLDLMLTMQSLLFLQEQIWICLSQHISSQHVVGDRGTVCDSIGFPVYPNTTRANVPPPPHLKQVWQAASAVNLSREDVRVM